MENESQGDIPSVHRLEAVFDNVEQVELPCPTVQLSIALRVI